MKTFLSVVLCILLSSCAHTAFYHDGKKVASFQGDMVKSSLVMSSKGDVTWTVDGVVHSASTKAQGEAASGKITAVGTIVSAVLTTLVLLL